MSGATKQSSCPSDLVLDRYRLSDLPKPQQVETRSHIDECERCAERLASQQQESAAFGEEMNIANLAVDALQRAEAKQPRSWAKVLSPRWIGAVVGAAACALLAAVFWPQLAGRPGDDPGGGTRIKGKFSVKLQVKRGDRQWQASPSDWLEPGDNVRFILKTQKAGYLYIVGVDAARKVTLYEPYEGDARRYQPAQRHEVPGAIELDETLGDERLIALLCKDRLDSDVVISKMTRAAAGLKAKESPLKITALPLPISCAQAALKIRKRR